MAVGKYKNLLVNILLFACNTVATKLITFLLVPLYTFYMTSSEFGITDVASTTVNLLLPLATLQISEAVLRYAIDDSKRQREYVTIGFGVTVMSCVIVGALLPTLSLNIFGGLDDYRWLFFLTYVASAFQGFFGYVARGLNQIKLIPISSAASSLTSGLLAWVFIGSANLGVHGYFYAVIAGASLGILVFVIGGREYRYIRFERQDLNRVYIGRMLSYSIPLVPNALSWWINSNVNRYFIIGMLGIGLSGLFAAASKIPNIINLLSQVFLSAWTLSAFQEFKKEGVDKFFSVVFKIFHAMGVVLASALILVVPWIASFMLQKEFYAAWTLVPIMIIAVLYNILSSFFASLYTSNMKTMFLFITTAAGALVTMIATPLLIKWMGLPGTTIAMLLGNLVVLILRVKDSRKIMAFSIDWLNVLCTEIILLAQAVLRTMDIPALPFILAATCIAICGLQAAQLVPIGKDIWRRYRRRRA